MAAELTAFDKALREEMTAMLEEQMGKPYPGPGEWLDLTAAQKRENADWNRRANNARSFVADGIENLLAAAKERFGFDVSLEDGEPYVGGSAPHSPTFVPDDQLAYKQWLRDNPGSWGRVLFSLVGAE